MNNVATAYVLWLGCLLQLHGLQRLYNGKTFTGLLWLFTFGLMGFGQLLDLVLVPGMVEEYNDRLRARQGNLPGSAMQSQPVIQRVVTREFAPQVVTQPGPDQLLIQLVKAAHARGGKISVTQAVMDTETNFPEVEAGLKTLAKTGYVDTYNDPHTGIVIYEFRELQDVDHNSDRARD
jgi:TM2 domain-containing membrane protein YozV